MPSGKDKRSKVYLAPTQIRRPEKLHRTTGANREETTAVNRHTYIYRRTGEPSIPFLRGAAGMKKSHPIRMGF